ncbi:hypothetical protein ZWY2020_042309 [Hordeum vulgare]|nr:hypothetical protein ZWY2020_042309 [Hordeum vulgare]
MQPLAWRSVAGALLAPPLVNLRSGLTIVDLATWGVFQDRGLACRRFGSRTDSYGEYQVSSGTSMVPETPLGSSTVPASMSRFPQHASLLPDASHSARRIQRRTRPIGSNPSSSRHPLLSKLPLPVRTGAGSKSTTRRTGAPQLILRSRVRSLGRIGRTIGEDSMLNLLARPS